MVLDDRYPEHRLAPRCAVGTVPAHEGPGRQLRDVAARRFVQGVASRFQHESAAARGA